MSARYVVCIDNSDYPVSLTLHKIYKVIPDARGEKLGDIRVADDSGEDYLFSADHFFPIEVPAEVEHSIDLMVA